MKRQPLFLLLALLTAALLFFALDLGRYLELDALRHSQATLRLWHEQAPLALALGYFGVYVLATALSVPGATLLTLVGGAVFGLGWGLLIVSFASSLGALLAFWVARFVLRDVVETRWAERLRQVNAGVARDGAFYLFALRLVPVVPFVLINLLMGLTRMRAWTYYWVSQVGMLAGTAVYVNAGTQLGQLTTVRGLLSPALLGSFALLAAFPWLARHGLNAWRRRRVYAPWRAQRPRRFERDLVVIGAGAGGLVSAYIAAAVKAKVTLVQAGPMGGDCLNTGCVPSKALIRSAHMAHQARQASRYGVQVGEPVVDFPAVMRRLREVVAAIAPHDSVERYTALGVEVLAGHARIVNPWTVEVALDSGGTQRLSTRHIVIATGARPCLPDLPGLADVGALTSDTLWDRLTALEQVPRQMLVLGGGPVGCELAQALARLGSKVTLVEQTPSLLGREDADVSAAVRTALEANGVQVLTEAQALRCEQVNGAKVLVVRQGGTEQRLPFDELLCALGRVARLEGYGLEALGIPTGGRTLETNEYLQTLYPNIFAVGDVAGPLQQTHVAAHQAWYAVVNALFGDVKLFKVDDAVLPVCTFTDPEVARVGLNEQNAQARGVAYEVTRFALKELDRALIDGETDGFVKVLTVPGKDRILGVTIVGPRAGEGLAEYVLAMKHGLGLNRVLGTVHAYPTLAEANKYAAGAWKRAHAPQRLLAWVERYHAWRRG